MGKGGVEVSLIRIRGAQAPSPAGGRGGTRPPHFSIEVVEKMLLPSGIWMKPLTLVFSTTG